MSLIDRIAERIGFVRQPSRRGPTFKRSTGFPSADTGRLFADWNQADQSMDQIILGQMKTLRTRARSICRSDDYAKKFLHLLKNNVVGPNGINLQMDVRDPNGMQDVNACDMIEQAWDDFSKKEFFTVSGSLCRADAEALLVEVAARDGEFFVRKLKGYNNPFRYSLQIIEADYLDHDYNENGADGRQIRMGVEFDKWRKPVAYHFLKRNPNDGYNWGPSSSKRERIDASEIIHGFVRISPEQSRGVTWFATSMGRIKMLNGFEEAALVAARIGASKMGFFEQTGDGSGGYTGDSVDASGNPIDDCSPGEMRVLPQGMKFSTFDPSYPHTEHSAFTKAILRGVAGGLGVSYNSLGSDLEGVNYSSIRAGLLEERDGYRQKQRWLIESFHEQIFPEWLSMALLSGRIGLPATKFEKFNRPTFKGRTWQWVDPLKDQEANVTSIENNLTTHGDVIAQQGGDFEETMRRIQRERLVAEKYGVDLTVTSMTKAQPAPADNNVG